MSVTQIQLTGRDHIPEEFTAEDLAESGFTEAEIEALRQGDENDPALIAEKAQAAAGAEGADDTAAQIGEHPVALPDPEGAQAAQAPVPGDQRPPAIEIPDVSAAEKVIADLDAKIDAISAAYDDGEITAAEMRERTKALVAEQAQAQMHIEKARSSVEAAYQKLRQDFFDAQEAYYKEGAADLMSQEHLEAWNRHLESVTGNPAYRDLTLRQWIEVAHRRYAREYEEIHGKPLPIPVQTATQAKAKLEARTDPRPEPLQTLAAVNGDTSDAIRDSRAAQLDKIAQEDPIKAESMLDGMSPDELDNYLRYA